MDFQQLIDQYEASAKTATDLAILQSGLVRLENAGAIRRGTVDGLSDAIGRGTVGTFIEQLTSGGASRAAFADVLENRLPSQAQPFVDEAIARQGGVVPQSIIADASGGVVDQSGAPVVDNRSSRGRFLERRGVGEGGIRRGSQAGSFIAAQFPELQRLLALQQTIQTAQGSRLGPAPQEIDAFTPQFNSIQDRSRVGSTVLSDFFNLSPEQRSTFGLNFERQVNSEGNLQQATGTKDLGFLQDLLRAGTRETAGSIGSNFLASRLPALRETFEDENQPGTFVDFFRNRFGL